MCQRFALLRHRLLAELAVRSLVSRAAGQRMHALAALLAFGVQPRCIDEHPPRLVGVANAKIFRRLSASRAAGVERLFAGSRTSPPAVRTAFSASQLSVMKNGTLMCRPGSALPVGRVGT